MFAERAERVSRLTPMLAESYAPESRHAEGSKLKPEMWSNREDFDEKLRTLVERSARSRRPLPAATRRKQGRLLRHGQACKACHDKYRAD